MKDYLKDRANNEWDISMNWIEINLYYNLYPFLILIITLLTLKISLFHDLVINFN